jgi:hypothetical protein
MPAGALSFVSATPKVKTCEALELVAGASPLNGSEDTAEGL